MFLIGSFAMAESGTVARPNLGDAFKEDTLNTITEPAGYDTVDPEKSTVEGIVGKIIRLALSLLGLIFILIIFLAADIWMKANGKEERVLKAKKLISEALIGIAFVLVAYALSYALGDLISKRTLT